jgi:hypothetical protein
MDDQPLAITSVSQLLGGESFEDDTHHPFASWNANIIFPYLLLPQLHQEVKPIIIESREIKL